MDKKSPKKTLVITSGYNHEPAEDDDSRLEDELSSIRSLGSFKLRFRTGQTVREKPTQAAAADVNSEPETADLNTEPEKSKDDLPSLDLEIKVQSPHEVSSEPEFKVLEIPKARKSQLINYELQKDSFVFDAEPMKIDFPQGTPTTEDQDEVGIIPSLDGLLLEENKVDITPKREEINTSLVGPLLEENKVNITPKREEINTSLVGPPLLEETKNNAVPVDEEPNLNGGVSTLSNDDDEITLIHKQEMAPVDETIDVEIIVGGALLQAQPQEVKSPLLNGDNPREDEESEEEMQSSENDPDSFHFLPPEEEPVLTPDFQERAVRSVASAIFEKPSASTSYSSMKCKAGCEGCCTFDLCTSKNSRTPHLSAESHAASKQGLSMMKKLLYPGLPKVFVDIWVLAELAITITQFVLAATSIFLAEQPASQATQVFNIIYLVVASIGLLLALIDSFLHFIQLGSCASTIKFFRKMRKEKRNRKKIGGGESPVEENERRRSCLRMSKKTKQQVGEIIDFVRNIITDFVLYPLLILDLYDLITSQSYTLETVDDRVNLSLFAIGVIFLVLSVYVVRIVMIVAAGLSLRRVPTDSSSSPKKIINMVTWFLVHVFAQVLVHASIFVSVGMNIYLENTEVTIQGSNTTATTNEIVTFPNLLSISSMTTSSSINSSFFLIFSVVAGLFVSQVGVVAFFIVNYYQIRELSLAFWIDMMSMLKSESFATLVFKGDGIKTARKKTKRFVQNTQLRKVKEDYKTVESAPLSVKLLYPFRIPVFVLLGILYFFLLVAFVTFLSIVCRPVTGVNEGICQSYFLSPSVFSIPYFFTFVLIILANMQVIMLVSLWLIIVLGIVVFIILAPVALVIYAILYVPLGALAFCSLLFADLGKEMDVLAKPSDKVSQLRKQHVRGTVRKELFGNEKSSKL